MARIEGAKSIGEWLDQRIATETIKKVMQVINNASESETLSGIVIIVNDKNELLGIVTDGDIRRALINGVDINQKVSKIMVTEPITVKKSMNPNLMLNDCVVHAYKCGFLVNKCVVYQKKGCSITGHPF